MASYRVSYYTDISIPRCIVVPLEQRVSRLEGAYEQVDRRLEELDRSVSSLRTETSRGLDSLRAEMNSRFNNLCILLFGSSVTIMVAIIGLYLRG